MNSDVANTSKFITVSSTPTCSLGTTFILLAFNEPFFAFSTHKRCDVENVAGTSQVALSLDKKNCDHVHRAQLSCQSYAHRATFIR